MGQGSNTGHSKFSLFLHYASHGACKNHYTSHGASKNLYTSLGVSKRSVIEFTLNCLLVYGAAQEIQNEECFTLSFKYLDAAGHLLVLPRAARPWAPAVAAQAIGRRTRTAAQPPRTDGPTDERTVDGRPLSLSADSLSPRTNGAEQEGVRAEKGRLSERKTGFSPQQCATCEVNWHITLTKCVDSTVSDNNRGGMSCPVKVI